MLSSQKMMSAPSGGGSDTNFKNVTLLLNGDGTNGAQNNTFVDSSSNNFTITRNGNTTQGSFSPYGSNWGNYFNGSSYLQAGSNSALAPGSGNFTIECWIFPTNNTFYNGIYQNYTDGNSRSTALRINTNYNDQTALQVQTSASALIETASGVLTANAWNHIALVRNGSGSNNLVLYVNGVSAGTATNTTNFSDGYAQIGNAVYNSTNYYWNGYISNFRVVPGTAVYTASFTPSTTPLTAISGTGLLTCQSNRFIDNSSNAFALTVNGTPSVQRFSPFNPTASYDTATIGGSGYFNRSSTISTSTNSNLVLTGNFTIEGWYYWNSFTSYQTLFALYSDNAYVQSTGSGGSNFSTDGAFGLGTVISSAKQYQWYHVAICRTGSTLSCFVNGVRTATTTNSNSIGSSGNTLIVGGQNTTSWMFDGYVSDFRVVKGTDVYGASNTSITIPTAPLTAITNTQLLTNFTNAGIPDSAMMNDLETVGNAQVSTSVKKFGTGSLKFDGTGDNIISNAGQNCAFGTGDFTIECWVYLNSISQYMTLFDFRPTSTDGYYPCVFFNNSSGQLVFYVFSSNAITATTNLSTGTWYHIAVCRSGTSTKMFINGTQTGSTYTDSNNYLCGSTRPMIGTLGYIPNYSGSDLNGYIDDLRITKGYARYTANFTPPTAALPVK